MTAWIKDRRGSVDLIELVLILPIFILLIYGFFEVWKIVSVKQSLDAGTYQAARCLSVYLHNGGGEARERCDEVLCTELENNKLLTKDDLDHLSIRYYDGRENEIGSYLPCPPRQQNSIRIGCNEIFSIEAELPLPWSIFIPGLRSRDQNPTPTFMARHTSYIECGPTWATTP